ncbi:MAG: hypothetical protein R3304_13295 [Longimicrobiales bacterium]|nr:hypothetical protein [Longimicrobiales bacterium]
MSDARRTVRTFSTHADARAGLEHLLEHDVPASAVSISARGIRVVETVHPRGWLHAAGEGALSGALIGLLVGFFLGLLNLAEPGLAAMVLGFWGSLIGATVGLGTGLIVHAFRRGSERHTTERSIRADHFDLGVAPEHVEKSRRILEDVDAESLGTAA